MRRARGFTLIELMVSLALAGLIVAGAMQMHISFNRQSQRQSHIAEMQQTLRVSMLMLERALRQAGRGIADGKITAPGSGPGCGGPPVDTYAFQWFDDNSFGPARTTTTARTSDPDPDWFQVMFASDTPPIYGFRDPGANLQIFDNSSKGGVAPDLSAFNDGDLFQIVFPRGDKSCTSDGGRTFNQDCSLLGCTREVSAGTAHGGASGAKFLQHAPARSMTCFNTVPAGDNCAASVTPTHMGLIRHLSSSVTQYRVMPVGESGNPTATPKLVMRTAPLGNSDVSATGYPWQIIAENIEDLQLALLMSDGRICHQLDDPRLPAPGCDPTQASSVRLTLVARSEIEVAGFREGLPLRYENEPPTDAATPKDGYLRRALTAQVELRNMGANR